jgi:hypothetical protein
MLLDAALTYADLGYPVFPCAPGTKKPMSGTHGRDEATTDAAQIEAWWSATPNANIGLATDGLCVVDFDPLKDGSPNPWLADQPARAAELARAPLSLTPRGGKHFIFRQPQGVALRNTASKLAAQIDTRANGGYIVAPPSVVDGKSYRWAEGGSLDVSPDKLPPLLPWLVVELHGTSSPSRPGDRQAAANVIPEGQRDTALSRLAGNMRRSGMSESEILAALRQVNAERCRPSLPDKDVRKIAWSIARYTPDQVEVARVEDHATQDGLSLLGSTAAAIVADPGPFPAELLDVPGLVGDVIAYDLATAPRPQPVLALAGAICLQAVLAARKVRDERGNRTNLYVVGVAESGHGKDHPRKVNRNILCLAGLDTLEGPEELASDAGLVSEVEKQPGILFQLDEFGRLLRTLKDPRSAPWLYNISGVLLKFYSSADSAYKGKARADGKTGRIINQPCVSVFGTTVPDNFYDSLTVESLSDGFLARLLIFETAGKPERKYEALTPPPQSLIDAARWWGDFAPGGNLRRENPEPLIVPTDAAARQVWDSLAARVEAAKANIKTKAVAALWNRVEEKACRLALIYACSLNRESPVVDGSAASWGAAVAEYLTRRVEYHADQRVAENVTESNQKRLLRIIDAAGSSGLTKSQIMRDSKWLKRRDRDDILTTLVESGYVFVVETPTGGRPLTTYVSARFYT